MLNIIVARFKLLISNLILYSWVFTSWLSFSKFKWTKKKLKPHLQSSHQQLKNYHVNWNIGIRLTKEYLIDRHEQFNVRKDSKNLLERMKKLKLYMVEFEKDNAKKPEDNLLYCIIRQNN